MRRVEVRDFAREAAALSAEPTAVEVCQDGTVLGIYRPLPKYPLPKRDKTRPEVKAAAERLEATIAGILERTGMTEDEFVAELTENWEESVRSASSR